MRWRPLLQACVAICRSCGDECQRHVPATSTAGSASRPARHCEEAHQELLDALNWKPTVLAGAGAPCALIDPVTTTTLAVLASSECQAR